MLRKKEINGIYQKVQKQMYIGRYDNDVILNK